MVRNLDKMIAKTKKKLEEFNLAKELRSSGYSENEIKQVTPTLNPRRRRIIRW